MALNITDIYWLAGFMDGEACFSMWGKTPSITIAQKEMWPLEKVHKLVNSINSRIGEPIKKLFIIPCIFMANALSA